VEIAERFFHGAESAELQGLSGDAVIETFFRCWTRKEAFAKATGQGLARHLGSYQVSCRADEPARLLSISDPHDDPEAWSLYSFAPAPGYLSAVAIRHTAIAVRMIETTPGDVFSLKV
jgi:4'-phosphopantetheinyl transferase